MTELINKSLRITFSIQEIKQLVIDNIEEAQNIRNGYCLSKCTQYNLWHSPLIKFYKKNKTIKPTMADKLCFVILLSYPKHIIQNLNDISDIKLFSHDNTDLKYKEELALNQEEHENESYDCICSYEKLQKIHVVENIYSGIRLQVGSECITKHNLISNEEMKKFKENEKLLKEKRRELKEGKPIGYYKAEKERRKAEKERQKTEKENEIKQQKIRTGNYKTCYTCDINIVDIRKNDFRICNKCKINTYEEIVKQIKCYRLNTCQNCECNFIDIKYDNYLCKTCKTENKIIKCSTESCSTELVVDKNTNNIFCYDCEEKIIKCIDCKNNFIQNKDETKCEHCLFNYENNFIIKICVYCNEEMNIKSTESWRTYCSDCYIEVMYIVKNPPKCKCNLYMSPKTIKKDGVNKGRKALCCSKFPNGCNEFKML